MPYLQKFTLTLYSSTPIHLVPSLPSGFQAKLNICYTADAWSQNTTIHYIMCICMYVYIYIYIYIYIADDGNSQQLHVSASDRLSSVCTSNEKGWGLCNIQCNFCLMTRSLSSYHIHVHYNEVNFVIWLTQRGCRTSKLSIYFSLILRILYTPTISLLWNYSSYEM